MILPGSLDLSLLRLSTGSWSSTLLEVKDQLHIAKSYASAYERLCLSMHLFYGQGKKGCGMYHVSNDGSFSLLSPPTTRIDRESTFSNSLTFMNLPFRRNFPTKSISFQSHWFHRFLLFSSPSKFFPTHMKYFYPLLCVFSLQKISNSFQLLRDLWRV